MIPLEADKLTAHERGVLAGMAKTMDQYRLFRCSAHGLYFYRKAVDIEMTCFHCGLYGEELVIIDKNHDKKG